ncbi:hypothetical protein EIK77_010530 [Talaromyces pinophilus]|nr:hypothetical protein EIK77_010530 [Talaromyces pinophilus]
MQSPDLLPNTSEIGSLTANSNDESQFVGSSSGVFFVNTVRQAFAKSLGPMKTAPTPEFPAPEDTLVGSPSSVRAKFNASRSKEHRTKWTYDPQIAQYLGEAPGLEDARQLMMAYFKIWHPLFPFLHGPSFLQSMEALYTEGSGDGDLSNAVSEHHRACWTAIFQCVFNISSILQPDVQLAQKAKIMSAADALKVANGLLNRHDILSLQAILAIQLYLVASMSLRNASLLGGIILRAVLHAGFHRCPFRYQELSAHDCQLRKRIFWCFYAIDRYLSQALGLPLGIQDSDIDVCRPDAPEIHTPGNPRSVPSTFPPPRNVSEKAGNNFQHSPPSSPNCTSRSPSGEILPNREATLAGFVAYGELTGRALELFHKSIHSREIRRSAVLYLVSDVHKWWNNLPSTLQNVSTDSTESSEDASREMSPLEINDCLSILQTMCRQWEIARHCHTALSILLLNVQRQESSGSNRVHQPDNKPSTPSGRTKIRKTILARYEEDTTYNLIDNKDYQTQDSHDPTIAQQTEISHPNVSPSAMYNTNPHRLPESTTTQIYQEPGADDTTISPSEVTILAMPNNNNSNTEIIDGFQWPDESSFLTANFDLNMTDLFQNSSWDPMLFDAFNTQG